jgi:hypothetical protein
MVEKEQNKSVENLDISLIITIFIVYLTNVKNMTIGNHQSIKSLIINALNAIRFQLQKERENNLF